MIDKIIDAETAKEYTKITKDDKFKKAMDEIKDAILKGFSSVELYESTYNVDDINKRKEIYEELGYTAVILSAFEYGSAKKIKISWN